MGEGVSPAGLWGGRFSEKLSPRMQALNRSFSFDCRLAAVDVRASVAYAAALHRSGWLTRNEHEALKRGLATIADEVAEKRFKADPEDEDIHSAVERRLYELTGSVAGKLHTGRSRNDQVATDLRLYVMETADALCGQLRTLQGRIVAKAQAHPDLIMPGHTHLQPAQPILFSHWVLSFFWKLQRDRERFRAARRRAAVCPLGSGALAGNSYDLDRDALAEALGFGRASENSLDAVEDRDFVGEFLFAASLTQVHLSSLAETLILWSSDRFSFVRLDQSHCTGSSLMPQKRNPDALELIRGKTGRVLGHLAGLLVALKGLPSGYNRDLQEDKEGLFDTIDTLSVELAVVGEIIERMEMDPVAVAAAQAPGLLATDLADYLVRKGVPFREAHYAVGRLVLASEELGTSIDRLSLSSYQSAHPAFAADIFAVFDVRRSVAQRTSRGGTAPQAVRAQLEHARALLVDCAGDTQSEPGTKGHTG